MVNKITSPITPLGEIDKINEVVDEVNSALKNTATGTDSISILGTATTTTGSTNVGAGSQATANYGIAMGHNAKAQASSATALGRAATASGSYSVALGYGATVSSAGGKSIQIGYGTNSTANSLSVGFQGGSNYQLLDGATGKIPSDRIKYDGTTITVNANGELTSTGGGSGGASRNIGEIVASTIPLTDAGLHLLDGALISGSGSYADFVTYISGLVSTYPDLFTTESNWQSTVTQYGVCGKFVYNSTNNTVRLPKYSNKIYTQELDTTVPVVGNGMTLGIIGKFSSSDTTLSDFFLYDGASDLAVNRASSLPIAVGTSVSTSSSNSPANGITLGVSTDPTKSGLVAQLSDITTSLDGYYYIVVATTTKTDIEVDIDEIATDLNGKADVDLSNASPTSAFATAMNTAGIRTVVETYVSGTSWYRVYSDGWCEQGGYQTANGQLTFLISFNDNNYFGVHQTALSSGDVGASNLRFNSRTSTGAYISAGWWMACGFKRQGE